MADSLLAVVSSYRPSTSLAPLVRALRRDCDVVIVDDGSGPGFAERWEEAEEEGARIIALDVNGGIAAALNAGLRIAVDGGYLGAVTFDQDSLPPDGLVRALAVSLATRIASNSPPGVIVPEHFAGVRQRIGEGSDHRARRVIQSGMLIPTETLTTVGLLDEGLFIDLVDTEYELRCLAAGREVYAAPGTRLGHELGRTVRLRPLDPLPWPSVTTMVSTPFRYYYRARNRLEVTRRYFRTAPARLLRDLAIDGLYLLLVSASARPRTAFWRLMGRALADGVRGRRGKMPADLQRVAAGVRWREASSGDRPSAHR